MAKILLTDDDIDFLEMHSVVLQNKGYEVITAQSSKECLEKLENIKPDAVVLDVMMEKFDSGFTTSKQIKEKYKNGREYYALHGKKLILPSNSGLHPSREYIEWHNEKVYVT